MRLSEAQLSAAASAAVMTSAMLAADKTMDRT